MSASKAPDWFEWLNLFLAVFWNEFMRDPRSGIDLPLGNGRLSMAHQLEQGDAAAWVVRFEEPDGRLTTGLGPYPRIALARVVEMLNRDGAGIRPPDLP